MADQPRERRSPARPTNPPCPRCGVNDHVKGTLRTDYVVYFRCDACGEMWSREKPRPGTAAAAGAEPRPKSKGGRPPGS